MNNLQEEIKINECTHLVLYMENNPVETEIKKKGHPVEALQENEVDKKHTLLLANLLIQEAFLEL